MAGSKVDIGEGDAQTRILEGFQDLVTRAYPNMRMLGGIAFVEDDIAKYLRQIRGRAVWQRCRTVGRVRAGVVCLHIRRNQKRQGIRTTLKNLLEKFERKPYGWPLCSHTLQACQTLRPGQDRGHGG